MFQKSTTKPLVKAVSVLGILVLLAGCSTPAKTKAEKADSGPQPTADASIAKELLPFYEQKLAWETCGKEDRTYCTKVEVPANWSKPAGDRIKLAVVYRKAEGGSPLGSILMNPGGPGGSGATRILEGLVVRPELSYKFNVVSFDPRGVRDRGDLEIKCLDQKEKDEWLYGKPSAEFGSAASATEKRARYKKFVAACVKNTGPNLQFVDTISTARDLDVIRAVFGDSKINYLGYSYGAYLGNTYAALFPKRVGRMVLDSPVTPTFHKEAVVYQAKGFDNSLKRFLADCLTKKDCPFTGNVESAYSQVVELVDSLDKKPMQVSGRELTGMNAMLGITAGLTPGHFAWENLRSILTKALKGDGSEFLKYADMYNGRDDTTYVTNFFEAYNSIMCADSRLPSDDATMAVENKKVVAASAVFGKYYQFDALTCEQWPYPPVKQLPSYAVAGSDKILVLAATHDPATPYPWAVELATKVLANAQLITVDGEGHGAYPTNTCINKIVEDYFIKGITPTKDPNCKRDK